MGKKLVTKTEAGKVSEIEVENTPAEDAAIERGRIEGEINDWFRGVRQHSELGHTCGVVCLEKFLAIGNAIETEPATDDVKADELDDSAEPKQGEGQ